MNTLLAFLRDYGWMVGPPLALLAVIAWVYRPSARARYRRDGEIPFDK